MNVHKSHNGEWVECKATTRACPRTYHLENTTAAAANEYPSSMMDQLLEAMDPPTDNYKGDKFWYKLTAKGKTIKHREGGLPAIVLANGEREWWVNGKFVKAEPLELELW